MLLKVLYHLVWGSRYDPPLENLAHALLLCTPFSWLNFASMDLGYFSIFLGAAMEEIAVLLRAYELASGTQLFFIFPIQILIYLSFLL